MKIPGVLRFLICIVILTVSFPVSAKDRNDNGNIIIKSKEVKHLTKYNAKTASLENMNRNLYILLDYNLRKIVSKDSLLGRNQLVDSILFKTKDIEIDSLVKSNSFYFAGLFYLVTNQSDRSIELLLKSSEIRESMNVFDERRAKALFNLGTVYRSVGEFYKMEEYNLKSIEVFKKIFGESGYQLIDSYSSLLSTYIDLQETDKALDLSNKAIRIVNTKADSILPQSLADLYSNIGVLYSRLADFSKARIYLEKAEIIHNNNNLIKQENYINLINSLAITYGALGLKNKAVEYYQKGVEMSLAYPQTSSLTLNIINSYAINLADSGNLNKAEDLYKLLLAKVSTTKEHESQLYYEVLNDYANFLVEYKVDFSKALEYNSKCMEYVKKRPDDLFLRNRVYIGYSLSLSKTGNHAEAIKYIQELIRKDYRTGSDLSIYDNPDPGSIQPDKISLKIFNSKFIILLDNYRMSNNTETLKAAGAVSELVISLLEKMRLNINEEESRLLLGDKYRVLYFNAIRVFNELYKKTSDAQYLSKAFEYSEKSKVAGLLASTRELKASQFQIPADLAQLEFRLKRDLGAFNAIISEETNKESPNKELIRSLNEKVLKSTQIRDSLVSVFAKKYPAYYSIKYNTRVAKFSDIPQIVGRNSNYINYILSDSVLYIFLANRKNNKLISFPVDTSFFREIKQFRSLLSMPGSSEDASVSFVKFQKMGNKLYKTLIEPLRPYLISDKLIVSPDNLLSYIPFETLCIAASGDSNPRYRSLHYLMEDFDISYTYSATFMAESSVRDYSYTNRSVAFAPNYTEPIDIKSVLMSRQEKQGMLLDLPFARQEAEYVSEITHGTLYENSEAKESVYKQVSGNFDIIHLAMHTLLNDKDPMRSTLIFSPESDTLNDSYLKTFEVYGIPLKAKMVVLSSCNTGSGFLSTGEGILSLARGFIYSGSKSVVMSMWEIEDRSGTEIVKMFYKNLKKGYSKSGALRKARIDYLKQADQLRSHPYFWSALVVYGNNSPLYYTGYLSGALVIGALMIVFIVFYFRKRRYS